MSDEHMSGVKNVVLKPVFTDARGDIFDIVEGGVGHVGIVTFVKGAVRAKHYHKQSTQYSYVISGSIRLTLSEVGGGNAQTFTLEKGSFTTIPPLVVHRYEALADAEMLDITTLARTDDGYEKDTVRVG